MEENFFRLTCAVGDRLKQNNKKELCELKKGYAYFQKLIQKKI